MANFFAKIISSVIAFLFMLFPNNGALQYSHLQITNHTNIAAPKIIVAVKARDIDALEAMMCLNIKQNVENLPEKIGEMLDLIKGDIIESSWESGGGSYDERHKDGKAIIQSGIDIYLTTTEGNFYLGICWETANSFAMEEVGIRSIGLAQTNPLKTLAILRATEGVESWHD